MITVGASEARACFPQLLEQVARGERIIITKRGVAVAILIPVPSGRGDRKQAIAALRAFRRGRRLEGLSLRELTEEGRS